MKLRLLGIAILASALTLVAMPAASAQTIVGYSICGYDVDGSGCIAVGGHSQNVETAAGAGDVFTFINRYVTPNGNAWWEIQSETTGLCINWVNQTDLTFWDSCVAGDSNELFYTHDVGPIINLAGNLALGHDTYLQPFACGTTTCLVEATDTPAYTGWTYVPRS